jgi:hypothetical protein
MSAAEVIAKIKALAPEERERIIEFLVSDQELREDLQDSCSKLAVMSQVGRLKMSFAI